VAGIAGNLSRIICPEVTRSEAELRCPLLDSRVLQFVVDLPPIPWCQEKRLPRRAYRGVLPDAVISRPKTGVAGSYEALVAEWRASERPHAAAMHPVIARWVDGAMWRQALDSPDAAEVLAAWRVLQLTAWLERPRQPSPPAAAELVPACIQ
jgi:asparagine synthase (glutamine-hydrolysing)